MWKNGNVRAPASVPFAFSARDSEQAVSISPGNFSPGALAIPTAASRVGLEEIVLKRKNSTY
jgi:hypothetical protein